MEPARGGADGRAGDRAPRRPPPDAQPAPLPGPTREYEEARARWGDLSVVPTVEYLYGLQHETEHAIDLEEGKRLLVELEATGAPDERGYRTVLARANGHLRPVSVRDRSVAAEVTAAEKADPAQRGHVAAPFQGVVTITVAEGDQVAAGDTVATIEAMKMEAAITAPVDGTVQRIALAGPQAVEGGDLVVVVG